MDFHWTEKKSITAIYSCKRKYGRKSSQLTAHFYLLDACNSPLIRIGKPGSDQVKGQCWGRPEVVRRLSDHPTPYSGRPPLPACAAWRTVRLQLYRKILSILTENWLFLHCSLWPGPRLSLGRVCLSTDGPKLRLRRYGNTNFDGREG